MISLSSYHTFGLQSHCSEVVEFKSRAQLETSLRESHAEPFWLLGEGSNCVFVEDIDAKVGVIKSTGISVTETDDTYYVEAEAGENWHAFVRFCLQNRIYGLENLALIPGTVGAAPIQNIGAYGLEIAQFIHRVHCYDRQENEHLELTAGECQFAYRDSIFKQTQGRDLVIMRVVLALPKRWQPVTSYAGLDELETPSALEIFNKVVAIRQAKLPDPKHIGNAGSFFKNPVISSEKFSELQPMYPSIPSFRVAKHQVKVPAAWLIDKLGFKGKRLGGIQCHQNQPLVLTNSGNGTGEQLLTLARDIRDSVMDTFGITLENEVRLIGKQGLIEL